MSEPNREDPEFCESRFRHWMGGYTELSLEEVYDIYIDSDNKKLTKKQKDLLKEISKRAIHHRTSNPYIFRFPQYD